LKLNLAALALLMLPLAARAAAALDAPQGLTLSVDAAESGTLTWDPINRDDLMGYSVWMRQDKGEFTRLNIPTLVGKELKKLPMTTKSFLALKGIGKRSVELTVVAEYESGRSEPSQPVFSKKARRPALPEAAPEGQAGAARPSPTPTPAEEADAAAPAPTRLGRPAMAPKGHFHSSLALGFLYEQTVAKGYNSLNELGTYIVGDPNYDLNRKENWTTTFSRRNVRVPLSLEYGFLPSLEAGGEIAYSQEKVYLGKFDFGTDTFESYQSGESMEGSGFTNPALKVRLQPSQAMPLRILAKVSLSTGARSRLQAWGEYLAGSARVAGVDDNANRLTLGLELGERGSGSGLSYGLAFSPAASESASVVNPFGRRNEFRADHGQEISGELAYTLPWTLDMLPGSASAGFSLRSQDAGRWTVDGVDAGAGLGNEGKAYFRSFTNINLTREDQVTLFLEFLQNLYSRQDRQGALLHAVDTGGRLDFTLKPDGWIFGASGGFYY
jgi:hypothetical protein